MFKAMFENRKVICFDLDGTIVDTKDMWKKAFNNALEEYDTQEAVDIDTYVEAGVSMQDIWDKYIQSNQVFIQQKLNVQDQIEKTKTEFIKILQDTDLEAKKGFWEFLAEIKLERNKKIALVTNTPKDVATKILKKLDIPPEGLDFTVYGNEVKKPKPDPEIYNKVRKHFKTDKDKILVFEDSVAGATAAAEAGLDMVIIWDGQKPKYEFPGNITLFIEDFSFFPNNMDMYVKDIFNHVVESIDKKIRSNQ